MKLWLCFFLFLPLALQAQEMTNKKIHDLLEEKASSLEGKQGAWKADYRGYPLLVITDETANRMRVFTLVADLDQVTSLESQRMLQANFHSALDAKYAIYEDYVVAVFTHPLHELTEGQFFEAIDQVVNLAETFGSSYSSGDLVFPARPPEEKPRINVKPGEGKKN